MITQPEIQTLANLQYWEKCLDALKNRKKILEKKLEEEFLAIKERERIAQELLVIQSNIEYYEKKINPISLKKTSIHFRFSDQKDDYLPHIIYNLSRLKLKDNKSIHFDFDSDDFSKGHLNVKIVPVSKPIKKEIKQVEKKTDNNKLDILNESIENIENISDDNENLIELKFNDENKEDSINDLELSMIEKIDDNSFIENKEEEKTQVKEEVKEEKEQTIQFECKPGSVEVEFPSELPTDLYEILGEVVRSIPSNSKVIIEHDLGDNPSSSRMIKPLLDNGISPKNIYLPYIKNPERYGKNSSAELTLADIQKSQEPQKQNSFLKILLLIIMSVFGETKKETPQFFDSLADSSGLLFRPANFIMLLTTTSLTRWVPLLVFSLWRSTWSLTFEAGKAIQSAIENGLFHKHTFYRAFITYPSLLIGWFAALIGYFGLPPLVTTIGVGVGIKASALFPWVAAVGAFAFLIYCTASIVRWTWNVASTGLAMWSIRAKLKGAMNDEADDICKDALQLSKSLKYDQTLVNDIVKQYKDAKKEFQNHFEDSLQKGIGVYKLELFERFVLARQNLLVNLKGIEWEATKPGRLKALWNSFTRLFVWDPIIKETKVTPSPIRTKLEKLEADTEQLERGWDKTIRYDPEKLNKELAQKKYELSRFGGFSGTYATMGFGALLAFVGAILTAAGHPYIGGPLGITGAGFFIGGSIGLFTLLLQRKNKDVTNEPKQEILKIRPQEELDAELIKREELKQEKREKQRLEEEKLREERNKVIEKKKELLKERREKERVQKIEEAEANPGVFEKMSQMESNKWFNFFYKPKNTYKRLNVAKELEEVKIENSNNQISVF